MAELKPEFKAECRVHGDLRWFFMDKGTEAECRTSANRAYRDPKTSEVRVILLTPTILAHKKKGAEKS